MFFGFIGWPTPQFSAPGLPWGGRLGWMMLSDGNVDQVDLDLGTVTRIGQVWEPVPPYYWGSIKVWRPRFFGAVAGQVGGIVIGSPQGLYAWDGTTLTSPGQQAPDWLTDQAETDPGGAPTQMPVGLPGIYCMEVYNSRLWVAGKDVMSFSAPSNGADFSTVNGGGSLGFFGDNLVYSWMDLKHSGGYLYCFGDSSTWMVQNVQLTGSGTVTSPYETTFDFLNIDPQTGHQFPRPVGLLGRSMVTHNGAGHYLTQGGDLSVIDDKITNLWTTLDTSQFFPTLAPANVFGFRVMLVNAMLTDPWKRKRNLLLIWHQREQNSFWSVASQNLNLTQIGSYEQDSTITPYGTDGTSLYRLFAQPDETLLKHLATKSFRGQGQEQLVIKTFPRLYAEIFDNDGRGVSITGSMMTGGGVPGGTQSVGFELTPGKPYSIEPQPVTGQGIYVNIDLQSKSPDFCLMRLHVASEARTLFGA